MKVFKDYFLIHVLNTARKNPTPYLNDCGFLLCPEVLGKKEIESMRKGSFVVNVSRGELVDERALFEALKSNHLAGAALDVFPKEPYDGPLCELDNIVLTPHVATFTRESRVQMEVEAVENLLRFFKSGE